MPGRRRAAVLAALLVFLAIPGGAPHLRTAATSPAPRAYVISSGGRVQVLDTTDGTVLTSANTGAWSTGAAVAPDGRVYVVNGWAGVVTAVDPASGEVVGRIDAGAQLAQAVVRPDGKRLYVTGGGAVAVIDTETFRLVAAIRVGGQPQGIAVGPDGTRLYVANSQDGTVSVVDTRSASAVATIEVGGVPRHVAVSPDGAAVYVSSLHLSLVRVGTVTMIDAATGQARWSAPVGEGAGALCVTPDGRSVYVALDGALGVLDVSTRRSRTRELDVRGLAIAPGDRRVFLATGPTATVLDSVDNAVLATFQLSGLDGGRSFEAAAIAFRP
jgi:YVTN family beta-propeller protein